MSRRRVVPKALVVAAGAATLAALVTRGRRRRNASSDGLDILHLAFEDHRRPGSGGGGLRTHEINRRLAGRHRITVVTTSFPGARRRVEDGVTYRPLGLPLGYYASIVTYHLCTPLVALLSRADLVVEDFAAPMSSVLVPFWTARPTVAVVQWLFAAEASRRYRVPFHLVEACGLRAHRRFVAVSAYMAEEIESRNPRAVVDIVPGGAVPVAASAPVARTAGIVYLGRLQSHAKGLDLLLSALARSQETGGVLTVASDGSYRAEMESLARSLGIAERVRFVGRVEDEAKRELLRRAVVVVPSRFESFGLVVLEAFAAGTPVVAFDIPALRELVTPECGVLVAPFDVDALAVALDELVADPERVARMGEAARRRAEGYTWEAAAAKQERAYLAAVADHAGRRRARA